MSTIHNRPRRSSVAHQSGGRTADTSIRNGRRRTQSVAVTRREKDANPREKILGERAEQGNTSGATKVRHTIGDRTEAFFKPTEERLTSMPNPLITAGIPEDQPRLEERSVATFNVGETLFGDQVPLPVSYLDEINGQKGQVIALAPGKSAAEVIRKPYNTDTLNPAFVRDLFNLQVIDYITGQTDRNLTNLFVEDQDGRFTRIRGIDSDTSFGSNDLARLGRTTGKDAGNLFPSDLKIPQSYVDKLKSKKDELIQQWKDVLTPQESEMAKIRLNKLINDNDGKGHPEINDIPKNVEDFKKLGSYFKRFADRNLESEETGQKRQELAALAGKTINDRKTKVDELLTSLQKEISTSYIPGVKTLGLRNYSAIERMLDVTETDGSLATLNAVEKSLGEISEAIEEITLRSFDNKIRIATNQNRFQDVQALTREKNNLHAIKTELNSEKEKLQARILELRYRHTISENEKIVQSAQLQKTEALARETLFASFLSGLPPLKQAQTEDEAQVRLYEQTTAELNELAQAYYKARNQVNTPAIQRTVAGQTRLEIARNEALQAFHNYKPPVNLTPGYLEKLDAFKDGIYQHGPIPRPQAAFNPKVGIHGQSVRAQTAAGRPRLAPMPGAPSQVEQQAQSKPAAEVAPRPSTQLRPLRAPGAPGRPQ
jgi:hypothetical protein